MTEKLKTLKDICKPQLGQPNSNVILAEFEKELKQEAIKHHHHFSKPKVIERWTIAEWIEHFFNITEEDLENKQGEEE